MNYDREFEFFSKQARCVEKAAAGDTKAMRSQDIDKEGLIVDSLKALAAYTDDLKGITRQGNFMSLIGDLSINLLETQADLYDRLRTIDELRNQVSVLQGLLNHRNSGD